MAFALIGMVFDRGGDHCNAVPRAHGSSHPRYPRTLRWQPQPSL